MNRAGQAGKRLREASGLSIRGGTNISRNQGDTVANLSISRAWDETKGILARDGKLFVAVAAALILLPQVVAALFTGQGPQAETGGLFWGVLVFAATIIALIGQLAMVRLALSSGLSVGESIRHGLSRFLPFILAAILMVTGILLLFLLVMIVLAVAGVVSMDPAAAQMPPRDVAIIALVLIVPLFYLAVRLLPMVAIASAEPIGPIAILKRSWALTRGHFGRLLGFLLLFLVAAIILVVAVSIIIGLVVNLALGNPEPFSFAALVLALLLGIVQTAVTVVYIVMVARIYSQLAGEVTVPSSGT